MAEARSVVGDLADEVVGLVPQAQHAQAPGLLDGVGHRLVHDEDERCGDVVVEADLAGVVAHGIAARAQDPAGDHLPVRHVGRSVEVVLVRADSRRQRRRVVDLAKELVPAADADR
jgi:hypothetical protein